ncbi:MAG: transcription antitermination factor NusB [Chlorobi bacterium]|nr:transcription antitermination factor NusB [Chlorobiota bacterium]
MIKKSNRRIVREKCLQVLYAYQLGGDSLTPLVQSMIVDIKNQNDRNFAERLINLVVANQKELEERIKEKVSNWELDRIAVLDKILIKMAMSEILYFQDIPPKVSINEVIDIAKEYSTANSGKFINGILDSFLSDMKNEGKLNKTGRGLIDHNLSDD